ncbi:MAG TPA: tautomerase family protein [Nocardioides sp.]|uniref:tautomerase family protein n=1 Tax=Nocardioides sp. TaxID=35761 RepID=UPI002ED92198
MPHVEITIGAGRSEQQLRSMIHRVHTALVETVGARPDHVRIVVTEVARTRWATGDVTLHEMDHQEEEQS